MVKKLSRFVIKHGLIPVLYVIVRLYFRLIRIRAVGEEGAAPVGLSWLGEGTAT